MGSTILRMGLTVLTDLAEAGQAAHESSNNVDSSGIGLAFVPTIVGDGESGVDCSVEVSISQCIHSGWAELSKTWGDGKKSTCRKK